MNNFLIIIAFLFAVNPGIPQDKTVIGMDKDDLKSYMKEHQRGFGLDQSIIRQHFNYLKYVNTDGSKTWIFYFTDEDLCKSSKKICDYGEMDREIKSLNDRYIKTGENEWEYTVEGVKYSITLEEQDWYFTIREKRKD